MAGAAALVTAAGGVAAAVGPTGAAAAEKPYTTRAADAGADAYINYVAPRAEKQTGTDLKVTKTSKAAADRVRARAEEIERKNAGGNPKAARQLAKVEQQAIATGKNPRQIRQAKNQQTAKLLTILVEFGGHDDFSGFQRPATVFGDRTCVTEPAGTIKSGPLHNQIPDPATWTARAGAPDNQTNWVPNFDQKHYNDMLYTTSGITERVRTDLTGPDGQPGFDISGYTMRNMYEEMSKGAYTVTGEATPWITVPHSEAYYAASKCRPEESDFPQSMDGHPSNPLGAGQLAIDAVDSLAQADPQFPWADYDVEDQGDADGDGNVYEPDGAVDHLVLVHAGQDKSGGGGAEGTYAIWAHSSAVAQGYQVPGSSIKISNYIVQPEDSGVGVFAHEYGHDLGLPDLYDTSGAADSDIDFWDLMNTGSHSGPIFQSMPAHMGLWDKWVLGWADPQILNPGDAARDIQLGQTSRTPRGTKDGIRVSLPAKTITLATPHSGGNMWWSNNDQNWADSRLTRDVSVPSGTDLKLWMWDNYVIEQYWDYGFVEVSTDGGSTWSEQVVHQADGTVVSTNRDDNHRLVDYGNKKNGLTGSSGGWRHDYVDLAPYAGQTIKVRLRYATDAGFLERGWFSDDFSLTNGATTVWSDDVEGGGNGWTATTGSFTSTTGAGWKIDSGTSQKAHYYLAEWRNFDGFDNGLRYAYDTTYSSFGPWKVQKIAYNAPGMLVWYRDTTYGNTNAPTATTFDLPSTGSKGGLLLVDSHFDPFRRAGIAAVKDPSTLNNLPSRPQSSNNAFTTHATYPFTECLAEVANEDWRNEYCTSFGSQPGVSVFTDAKGWYPGLELRAQGLFFRDIDASVVVPSAGNQPYSTRIVDANGSPITDLYGEDLGQGIVLGSGNPADEGVAMGVSFSVVRPAKDNTYATVRVDPGNH